MPRSTRLGSLSLALANAMLWSARYLPVCYPDTEFSHFLNATEPYSPQRNPDKQEEFGADYVDTLLPVHHLTTAWIPPVHMSERAHVRFAQASSSHVHTLSRY